MTGDSPEADWPSIEWWEELDEAKVLNQLLAPVG